MHRWKLIFCFIHLLFSFGIFSHSFDLIAWTHTQKKKNILATKISLMLNAWKCWQSVKLLCVIRYKKSTHEFHFRNKKQRVKNKNPSAKENEQKIKRTPTSERIKVRQVLTAVCCFRYFCVFFPYFFFSFNSFAILSTPFTWRDPSRKHSLCFNNFSCISATNVTKRNREKDKKKISEITANWQLTRI